MNAKQIDKLKQIHNIQDGQEWEPFSGFDSATESKVRSELEASKLFALSKNHVLAIKASSASKAPFVKRDYFSVTETFQIPGLLFIFTSLLARYFSPFIFFRHFLRK